MRSIKLSFLLCFFCYSQCFCQQKIYNTDDNRVVNQFNTYLKAVNLNALIRAVDFSFKSSIAFHGPQGAVTRKNVNVLTLQPGPDFSDPPVFSDAWRKLLTQTSGKANIYSQLFFLLATNAKMSPDSLVIIFESSTPEFASFMIYFNKGIKVIKSLVQVRDGAAPSVNIDPGDLDNGLLGGFFANVPKRGNLVKALKDGINAFLKGNNRLINVGEPKQWQNEVFNFDVKPLKGRVTGRFYEEITVNITIIPKDNNYVDVEFRFYVSLAASGPNNTPPANFDGGEDAVKRYKGQVSNFGAALRARLRTILYDEK